MASIHVTSGTGSVLLRIVSTIQTSTLELDIADAVQLASEIQHAAHEALAADDASPAV